MGIKGVKGGPKTPGSGRKKGSRNKNSLQFQELLDNFDEGKGFEPITEMLNLYTLIHADNPLVAVNILKCLVDRKYPALKAIEHSGEIANPYLNKSLEELEALVREKLKK